MPIRPPMMSNAILISMLRYYRKSFLTYFPIPSNVHSSGIYNLGMNDIGIGVNFYKAARLEPSHFLGCKAFRPLSPPLFPAAFSQNER